MRRPAKTNTEVIDARNAAYLRAKEVAQRDGYGKTEPLLYDIVQAVIDIRDKQWEDHLRPYDDNIQKLLDDLFFITAHQDGDHGVENYHRLLQERYHRYLVEHPNSYPIESRIWEDWYFGED